LPSQSTGNRILEALPKLERERVLSQLKTTDLRRSELIYDVDKPLSYVYFPTSAVLSMLALSEQGNAVEIATIGHEGFAGVQVILGTDRVPNRAICQVAGSAYCTSVETVRDLIKENRVFHQFMQRFTQSLMVFMGQSIACNRFHTIQQRCARWLALTADRAGHDTFELTQEFLSMMLGVHRPGVSVAAAALQHAGLITYKRGVVTVTDRGGLEAASCECCRIVTNEFERLYGLPRNGNGKN